MKEINDTRATVKEAVNLIRENIKKTGEEMSKTKIKNLREVFSISKEVSINDKQRTFSLNIEINHVTRSIKILEHGSEKQFIFRDPLISKIMAELLLETTQFAEKRINEYIINEN